MVLAVLISRNGRILSDVDLQRGQITIAVTDSGVQQKLNYFKVKCTTCIFSITF